MFHYFVWLPYDPEMIAGLQMKEVGEAAELRSGASGLGL